MIYLSDSRGLHAGRLAAAWNDTPTKWYPLPFGVGALLLAVLQWRKRTEHESGEIEDGASEPPVKVKGRWKVSLHRSHIPPALMEMQLTMCRSLSLEHFLSEIFLAFGATSILSSYPSGFVPQGSLSMRGYLGATWTKLNIRTSLCTQALGSSSTEG